MLRRAIRVGGRLALDSFRRGTALEQPIDFPGGLPLGHAVRPGHVEAGIQPALKRFDFQIREGHRPEPLTLAGVKPSILRHFVHGC
jgi:hypothetical protein